MSLAPDPSGLELQPDFRASREALVGWLVKVHDQYFRRHGTPMMFLAVNIIDRFVSCRAVQLDKWQLVAVAALFVANKFENGPEFEESSLFLERVCGGSITADQIVRAERYILRMLDYRLAWPGPLPFLDRISRASQESGLTRIVAEYVLEASLVSYASVLMLPSLIAATAFFLAQSLMGNCTWVSLFLYSFIPDSTESLTKMCRLLIRKMPQGIAFLNYILIGESCYVGCRLQGVSMKLCIRNILAWNGSDLLLGLRRSLTRW